MNYEQMVEDMLIDAGEDITPEKHVSLVRAFGFGMAQLCSLVKDHAQMHAFIDQVVTAIHHEACEAHTKRHGNAAQEHALHTFVPGEFHA